MIDWKKWCHHDFFIKSIFWESKIRKPPLLASSLFPKISAVFSNTWNYETARLELLKLQRPYLGVPKTSRLHHPVRTAFQLFQCNSWWSIVLRGCFPAQHVVLGEPNQASRTTASWKLSGFLIFFGEFLPGKVKLYGEIHGGNSNFGCRMFEVVFN